VAKAELGVKRRCLSCGAAFFDLNREPIACPKCSAVFQVVELPHSAPRKTPYRSVAVSEPSSDDQAASEDAETAADTDGEAEAAEPDDSVIEPIEEEDRIEEIGDLM
jgi:uncharacterized protein (TIGR02300 family)